MSKDVAISVERNMKEKEAEKILKYKDFIIESDVWLTVHRNSVWIRKTN